MKHQDSLFTFAELSTELKNRGITRGIAIQTLHRWRASGKLAARRIGGTWYTTLEDFDSFVASRSPSTKTNNSVIRSKDINRATESLTRVGW